MTCSDCRLYSKLNGTDRWVCTFYHDHGIRAAGDITLYVFDAVLPIRVIHRPGPVYTVKENGRWAVWMDTSLDLYERRVRMAHEIGHMLLHAGSQFLHSQILMLKQEEQARRFALYALAPTCFLLPTLAASFDSPRRVCFDLSMLFGVPAWFMRTRLERLEADAGAAPLALA